jgi:PadR family transcriptional regulator PadR
MSLDERFNPIRKGLLEFLVLKIVAANQVYAADILRELSGTEFSTQEGTLYPLLSKIRREGLVDYEWKESESGPPRKYYELTAKGRARLQETADYWAKISGTVKNLGQK